MIHVDTNHWYDYENDNRFADNDNGKGSWNAQNLENPGGVAEFSQISL